MPMDRIPVMEKDMYKTCFTTQIGTFLYTRWRFGLIIAPATFHLALDIVLSGVGCKSSLVYLHFFIVFSPDDEQHLKDLDETLDRWTSRESLRKCKTSGFSAE